MWTSLKNCSHCVAVAQCLNITDGYISWFTTNWSNLTKLTNSHFGQNIGKKPTQSHHSQRKAKPPILGHTVHSGLPSELICMTVSASRFPMQGTSTISASDVSCIINHLVYLFLVLGGTCTTIPSY